MVGSLQYVLSYELVSKKRDFVYRKSIYKDYLVVKDTIESTIQKVDFDGNGIGFYCFRSQSLIIDRFFHDERTKSNIDLLKTKIYSPT